MTCQIVADIDQGALHAQTAGRLVQRPVDDRRAVIEAYERHNTEVRRQVSAEQLLEWTPADGGDQICQRLGLPVPNEGSPVTNTTDEFRQNLSRAPLA